jgi:uncharacterized protein (TIGR02722 family)
MKKEWIFIIAVVLAIFLTGCASSAGVQRVSSDTQIDLSGRWNDTDVRQVCETLITDCFKSQNVNRIADDWRGKHRGENPIVIVGRFSNKSSEHLDTTIISKMMQTAIINSGRLDFVAGSDTRDQLRDERADQADYANEDTATALTNETAATFMLTGTVNSIVDKSGGTSVRSYFVDAQLINIETNRIIWQAENNDIKKVITQAKAKL